MLTSLWSVKGGVGTTVVAAALGLHQGRSNAEGSLLVDLDGDLPAALGIPDAGGPGVGDWLGADHDVGPEALSRLHVAVGSAIELLPRGGGWINAADRAELLAGHLASLERPVVVDCGTLVPNRSEPTHDARRVLAASATHSLLVTRACYLALNRACRLDIRPSGVVLLREPARALTAADVEEVVGAPVRLELAIDSAVARAVDAGLLTSRLPRGLARTLQRAA